MTAYVKIYLVMDKSSYAPKEIGSNKQRIRRFYEPPLIDVFENISKTSKTFEKHIDKHLKVCYD